MKRAKLSIIKNKNHKIEKNKVDNWNEKLSDVVCSLAPSGIREFFDIVASRKDCISLGVGEPDFVSPDTVINSSIAALRSGYTHYTGNQGLPSFRKTIASYLQNQFNIQYNPEDEILVTVGVSQGVDLALRSIVNPGDGVLYPSPGYVSYAPMIELAGGHAIPINTSFENNFALQYDDLIKAYKPGTKAILLNYPCNPTGASMNEQELNAIARFVKERDLLVISDEIYAELSYENEHIPFANILDMRNRTMMLAGLSKSFAMTGWRIAYACGPTQWMQAMIKIHQYSMLCAPTVSQIAGENALLNCLNERDDMIVAYKKRREFIVEQLNSMGLECLMPSGAFYVFPSIKKTGLSSLEFARRLLNDQNVAVVPGTAFGKAGEGFIRCSYASSLQELELALKKINHFVQSL